MADRNGATSPQQLGFPRDFLWGAATASYQIEGGAFEDGRGPSIWDTFSHTPGKTKNGDTGDVACDHYHRWREDVALMRELGLNAYRFSIAWPRIVPEGRGQASQAGLDFYERLVDELLANGIRPFATIYHWDLPQVLQNEGGWANRATAYAYADYAELVTRRLGDRVKDWMTHNEPWVAAFVGNLFGEHAPGLRDLQTAVDVSHHLLLSHGLAVPRIREASPGAQVGIALNLSPAEPATDTPEDKAAAMRSDAFSNTLFLDPLARGTYPELARSFLGDVQPPVQDGDMALISVPIDFVGVNYYQRSVVRDAPGTGMLNNERVRPEGEYTSMDWEVYPEGLRLLLERLRRDYSDSFPAYYVTENGAAFPDEVEADGRIHDERRVAFLQAHIAAAGKAIQNGVPLRGYFIWSLMDNFEWGHGYTQRFGLVYVDYATQQRLPKDSALWYKRFLEAR